MTVPNELSRSTDATEATVAPDARETQAAEERRRRGFTLIEIMAVVLIMGMLMTLVGVAVANQIDKARQQTARAQMAQLEQALELYRMDNSRYPTTEQGLVALVEAPSGDPSPRNYPPGGYLRKRDQLLDPWGEPYQYRAPGERSSIGFDVFTLGADGSPGGEGVDEDLGNWGGETAGT